MRSPCSAVKRRINNIASYLKSLDNFQDSPVLVEIDGEIINLNKEIKRLQRERLLIKIETERLKREADIYNKAADHVKILGRNIQNQ